MGSNDILDEYLDENNLKHLREVTYSTLRKRISENLSRQYKRMESAGTKITHTQIAHYCSASPSTETRWFKGERLPGIDDLSILSNIFDCTLYELIENVDDTTRYTRSAFYLQDLTYAEQMSFYLKMYLSPDFVFSSPQTLIEMIADPVVSWLVRTFFWHYNHVKENQTTSEQLSGWIKQVNIDFDYTPCPISHARFSTILNMHPALMPYDTYKNTVKYIHDHADELTKERLRDTERYYFQNGDALLSELWSDLYPDDSIIVDDEDFPVSEPYMENSELE